MRLSVIIPSFRRPSALAGCLERLSQQRCDAPFEILVGLDGDRAQTPDPTIPPSLSGRVRVIRYPKVGLIELRRRMLDEARGDLLLWLNDDAHAHPGLLRAHLEAHDAPRPRVIAGRAVWSPIERPDLFDAVVRETDLIFFRRLGASGLSPTDFRNCFGLNMSFPRTLAHQAGGIAQVSEAYGYEDIEFAWRLARAGAELCYAPEAVVIHDHRYRPLDVHRREYLLGRAAWCFAGANPEFALELFRRDIRDPETLGYFMQAQRHERRDAVRIERSFLALSSHTGGEASPELLPLLAEHWVPLKRYLWRWGVLDAADDREISWDTLAVRDPGPESDTQ